LITMPRTPNPSDPPAGQDPGDEDGADQALDVRERSVSNRETCVGVREKVTAEHERVLTEREQIVRLQEEAVEARTRAERSELERERLLVQMRDANEALVLATVLADELTEEANAARAAEAEGRHRAEALATRLTDSEDALRASEGQAQASNRAKDEFLAMLGHELRNPLGPMLLALDSVAMRGPDPFEREHAMIRRQAKHLVRLVDDLLDVSRIASGKVELRREPVELFEIVAQAVELADPMLVAKAHALTVDVAPGLVIDGDRTRLAQVVGNILTNAAKYTPGGGSISVTGRRYGATVSLRIRDTGIGISKEMLPRVFDLFAQERQSSERPAGGLGLGLAIVRNLVAMHGGTVTARSEGLGHGSEFVIVLPVSARVSEEVANHPAHDTDAPVVSRKLLVVDDNRDAAQMMALTMSARGHEVRVAYDGPSALSLVDAFIPDVALLDIGLPEMDGYELARRLSSLVAPHVVRFIAVTGYGAAIDHRRSEEAGFVAHLVKPVDVAGLEQALEQSLEQSAPPR